LRTTSSMSVLTSRTERAPILLRVRPRRMCDALIPSMIREI
jgi:hypothetical protein